MGQAQGISDARSSCLLRLGMGSLGLLMREPNTGSSEHETQA